MKKLDPIAPRHYLPLYMVTFTPIPYIEAARRARRQDRIVYASLIVITMSILLFRFRAVLNFCLEPTSN